MDVSVTGAFCFLLLILPQISLQQDCSQPDPVRFNENNKVGDPVGTIPLEGVTLELDPDPNEYFTLDGNVLKAAVEFDYEKQQTGTTYFFCTPPGGIKQRYSITFIVGDVNDNPPIFEKSLYEEKIKELSPPDTEVGTFSAQDLDKGGRGKLYYKLTPESKGFRVVPVGISEAKVVTTKAFDYETEKFFELELYVQDTEFGSEDSPSFNDTTTIKVNVTDIDNRPPWFQPCTKFEVAGTTVCIGEQSYTGSVYLNEQETGELMLDPNPVRAIDGDTGINELIVYSILSGNDAGVFEMNSSTGSITMLKPVTTTGTITLSVLANQKENVHQFAVTTVSIQVLTRTDHKPQFPQSLYMGIVTTVGTMVENKNNMSEALRILATDADYPPEGKNPNIIYSIIGNEFFSLNDGYLFMTTQLEGGSNEMEVVAVDTLTKETATTRVVVEVESGPTVPPSTTTTVSLPPEVTPSSTGPTPSTGTTLSGATPSSTGPTPSTGTTVSGATPSSTGPTPSTGTTVSGATPSSNGPTPSTGTTLSGATPSSAGPTPSTGTTVSGATPSSAGPTPSTGTTVSGATPSSAGPALSTITTISGATPPSAGPTLSTITTISGATPSSAGPTLSSVPTVPSVSTPVETTTGVTSGNITPSGTPTTTPGTTADSRTTTSGSNEKPDGSSSTPSPSSTANQPHTGAPPGGFNSTDMAALGASLGVLLFLALVIMTLLFCRLRRENRDWKKIYESNLFRSSLGQNSGGAKDGVQYTNNAFDNDEDSNNKGSGSLVNGVVFSAFPDATDYSKYESIVEPKLPTQGDDSSQSGSEKEVKPILTKERRVEEGYKSVWFKEDIDPDAKEEVVIIPDSRENVSYDEDEDEDSSSDRETGDESPRRTSRVMFSNSPDKNGGEVLSVDL